MPGGPGNLKIGIYATVGDFAGPARAAMQQARSAIASFGGSSFFDQTGGRAYGNPRGQSARAVADSIAADQGAWNQAMRGLRPDVMAAGGMKGNSPGMLGWYGMERMNPARDAGNQARMRRSAMLPFGNSASYSVTQADIAAATAEADAAKMTRRERRMGHLQGLGMAAGAMGGPGMSEMAMGLSYAGSGFGLIGGLVVLTGAAVAMKQLADEAKRVNQEARQMGVSIGAYLALEKTSKETGLNLGAVGQGMASARQGAFGSPAAIYGQLGIGRGDMSMETLAAAFDKIKDPVARARAEIELFGQAAPEMAEALRTITTQMSTPSGRKAAKEEAGRNVALSEAGPLTSWETAGKWLGTEFALSARATGRAWGQGDYVSAITGYGTGKGGKYYEAESALFRSEAETKKKDAEAAAMKAASMRAAMDVLGREGAGLAGAQDVSRGGTGQAFDYIYKMSDAQLRESEMTRILQQGNDLQAETNRLLAGSGAEVN